MARKLQKDLEAMLQGLSFAEAEEARTPDNLIKSQVLYQLSYNPILNCRDFLKRKRHRLETGLAGFEPANARIKIWCLTAWR